ncbi:MAG: glutamate--cysteine ligase [Nannocystales bacterium]
MTQPKPEAAELRRDQLVTYFEGAVRSDPSTHLIGTELERFGLARDEEAGAYMPVRYAPHVKGVLEGLIRDYGWAPGPDRGTDGEVVELRRNGASITLEPGGQFELSGAPLTNVHETCEEFSDHYEELDAVSRPLGLTWLAIGYHPFATREQINWMPKGRYEVMRNYLPTKGSMALDMMSRTCTVQANFDYSSEAQCGERLRRASALAPIVMAMFANSPLVEGQPSGRVSSRSWVWTDVDNDRCGIRPFFFERPFSFERYVDWVLDVPMFFFKRGGEYVAHHQPFRHFLEHGAACPDGTHARATYDDWLLHLSTVFPEVRLKPHLEFRSADAVGSRFLCALPALLKGLLYDDAAGEEAMAPIDALSFDERVGLWHEAANEGLKSARVHELAKRVFKLSQEALEKFDVLDSKGRRESRFLEPLAPLIDEGISPGEDTLRTLGVEKLGTDADARTAIAAAWRFAGVEP